MAIGFIVTFVIGGMTGVLLAVPPADFLLHNSLFLVAHFHNVIIGGVLFGAVRRLHLLVPQGLRLPPRRGLGKAAFWCWFVGFYLAFMPLYVVGLMGMTRRMQHYDVAGMAPLAAGRRCWRRGHSRRASSCQVAQLVVSIRHREELRDPTGDPWDGRSLEWSTSSPPPAFNFAVLPHVEGEDAYWLMKQRATRGRSAGPEPAIKAIEMPRNSATGFVCAFFAAFRASPSSGRSGGSRFSPSSAPSPRSSSSPGATAPSIGFRPRRWRASIARTAPALALAQMEPAE